MSEGTGKITFPGPGRSGDEKGFATINPFHSDEAGYGIPVKIALRAELNRIDRGWNS